jgi:peptidoglycan-associated lipoprotein
MIVAGLSLAACANNPTMTDANAGLAGSAAPGSAQDFVVNVGDRVFFESDSSELTPQSIAILDKQAQWLGRYNRYAFTVEGHADERGTREYNIALGARRAQAVRDYLTSRGVERAACAPSPTARSARSRCATTSRAGRRTAAR